ncbi:MAG: hypothetical protein HY694_05705 [Deltaproteobacteria bacterium]|nr:hypothetical protein [Deltaproteobacteria bacterium]
MSPFIIYLGDNLIGSGITGLREGFEKARAEAAILPKEDSLVGKGSSIVQGKGHHQPYRLMIEDDSVMEL